MLISSHKLTDAQQTIIALGEADSAIYIGLNWQSDGLQKVISEADFFVHLFLQCPVESS
jgi:hypothetical protein